ncbi:MAG: phage portal protein [Synergistaceae bacterium]|nr:phage portal protein [Synergistaceae bacterium]
MDKKAKTAFVNQDVLEPIIKSLVAVPSEGDTGTGIVYPPVSLQSILDLTHSNAFHTTCIEKKASMTVGLDYEAPTQVERFLEEISGSEPFMELLQRVVYDWESIGNGYFEVARTFGGKIGEIGHVHGHTIYAVQNGKRLGEWWQETNGAGREVFAPFGARDGRNELLQFRQYTPLSSFYGLPTWIAALEALRLDQQKKIFYSSFFSNFAMPSVAVVLEGAEFDERAEQTVKDAFADTKGAENAHKTMILSVPFENAKVHFEKLMMDLKDMPFDKLSQATREEILAAHAVPPRIVGIVTAGSLGGGGETDGQLKIFNETTIKPRMAYVERRIKSLLRDAGLPEEFKLSGIVPETGEDSAVPSQETQAVLKSLRRDWGW